MSTEIQLVAASAVRSIEEGQLLFVGNLVEGCDLKRTVNCATGGHLMVVAGGAGAGALALTIPLIINGSKCAPGHALARGELVDDVSADDVTEAIRTGAVRFVTVEGGKSAGESPAKEPQEEKSSRGKGKGKGKGK